MKRILSIMLAVCILLSLSIGVFAATMTMSADTNTVKAGSDVVVTLTLSEEITNVNSLGYKLFYDNSLFEMKENSVGKWAVSNEKTDRSTGKIYRGVTFVSGLEEGDTVSAGTIGTITFTAKEDVSEETNASFNLVFQACMVIRDGKLTSAAHEAAGAVDVTVTPAGGGEEPEQPTDGYEVTVSGPSAKTAVGDEVEVTLAVNKAYAPYEIAVSYDSSKLTYKSVSTTGATAYDNAGTLLLTYANADSVDTTENIVLIFTATAEGSAEVSVTSAAFESVANSTEDLLTATIKGSPVTIEIGKKQHNVTLPIFFEGEATVADGEDYTFKPKDTEHYDYSNVTATVNGEEVTVTKNDDGSYTVKNVKGDLTITGTQTAKQYNVTKAGTGAADVTLSGNKASYGADYTFTVTQDEAYNYTVTVTIGDEETQPTLENGTYTIPGAKITGDIVITVDKTQKPAQTTTITFEGSGSGDVKGGTSQTATNGQDFSFEIDKKTGYTYTVKLGNETLTSDAEGKYTIPGREITGTALTVTVERTADINITVSQYLKLDEKAIFLVTATSAALEEGQVLGYGENNAMYWSANYNAYAYLVISDKSLEEVTKEAKTKVTIQTGTKTEVQKTADVNGSGKLDANDAQMVYNMYNVKYEQFGEITMVMFLRADQNTDRQITTQDAVAVINAIVTAKKG